MEDMSIRAQEFAEQAAELAKQQEKKSKWLPF
jgi:hypothetical protein